MACRREDEEEALCGVCAGGASAPGNLIVFCERCDLAVHQACYGIEQIPPGAPPTHSHATYLAFGCAVGDPAEGPLMHGVVPSYNIEAIPPGAPTPLACHFFCL